MDTIDEILRAIIDLNKLKSANKQAMVILIEQEGKISQEEAVLLKKLLDYHKCDSKKKQDCDLDVKDLADTNTDTITDDVSDTSTEPLSDEEDDDKFDRDELQHKSVTELKEIYASLYDRKPRGKSASKVEWLIDKIIDKSGERTKPVKENKRSVVKSKTQPPPPPPQKKPTKKDNDLNVLDDDLDQLVYGGVEYDITKISSEESWLLIDGKQVGKIKTISGEGVFDDNDNKRVVMLEHIYEGVKYYLVNDDSDKSNKLLFNPNEEYVGLYNISKDTVTFCDKSYTKYHHYHRC